MELSDEKPVLRVPFPPLLHLLGLVAGLLVHFIWKSWGFLPETWIGHAAGWPVVVLAVLLMGWTLRTMSRSGEDPDPGKPTSALISTGPFSITRNPLYVTITLLYIGIALIVDTIWMFIFLPVALLHVHFVVIVREERYLEQLFPEEYVGYRAQVRRWI